MTTSKAWAAIVVAGCGFVGSGASLAGPDKPQRLLADLQRMYPGTAFSSVKQSPMPGLYEVWMGDNVAYVMPGKLRYLLFGHIFDTKAMTDLTVRDYVGTGRGAPQAKGTEDGTRRAAIPWGDLPFGDAITTVRGTGERQLALFTDPACPYCKRLEHELEQIDDVTIHRFVVPYQGVALPAAILCADDREQAWRQVMMASDHDDIPLPPGNCANPLERNTDLARRLSIRGTPTIVFPDGTRAVGQANADEITARLGKTNASRPAESVSMSNANDLRTQ